MDKYYLFSGSTGFFVCDDNAGVLDERGTCFAQVEAAADSFVHATTPYQVRCGGAELLDAFLARVEEHVQEGAGLQIERSSDTTAVIR